MAKTSGTVTQSFSVNVNVDSLINKLVEQIPQLVEDAIADQAGGCDIDDWEYDGEYVSVSGKYTTGYSAVSYPATREDPAEYDETRDIDAINENKLIEYIKSHIEKQIDITDALDDISVSAYEDDTDAEYEEDEPDWDMMPGGHDDY